jgi:hypothetical protein
VVDTIEWKNGNHLVSTFFTIDSSLLLYAEYPFFDYNGIKTLTSFNYTIILFHLLHRVVLTMRMYLASLFY